MSDEDLEAAVAAYRAELSAEADLARGDLDEIEDHLRALVDELRADGRADVIAEARRRLGDPRAIAREHARVRTPFGAKPSRAQAWSAALLLAPITVWFSWQSIDYAGWISRTGFELALSVVLLGGLVARQAWARAVLLGHLVVATTVCAFGTWLWPETRFAAMMLAINGGALLFLMPRRRGELSATGTALALLAPAYGGAAVALSMQMTGPDGVVIADPFATTALIAAIVAGAGLLLRARWAAIAAAVGAPALAIAAWSIDQLHWRYWNTPHPLAERALVLGVIGGGAIAAAAAAVLAWRGARHTIGTLRGVIS